MLRIVGDINFTDGFFDTGIGVGSSIRNMDNPFKYIERSERELWIGNFESVCASVSNNQGVASKQFIIAPKLLRSLQHLDIYAVANNHVMQHGADAYIEMLSNIESFGAKYVGSLNRKTLTFNHQGRTVAITAFNQRPENFSESPLYWSLPEYNAIEKEFESAVKNAFFKIVYIHWGNEFMNFPYVDQQKFAHWLVDLGYDLVIGMHPHILQGFEVYKDRYIFYSLGNFIFNMAWYKTKYAAIVNVDLSSEIPIVTYNYTKIGKDYYPSIVEDTAVPENCRFSYLNKCIINNIENEVYYNKYLCRQMRKYRKANYWQIIKDIPRLDMAVWSNMIIGYLKRRIGNLKQ